MTAEKVETDQEFRAQPAIHAGRMKKPAFGEEAATEIGAKFVASWGGRFLRLGKPILDLKQWIWHIPLFVPNPTASPQDENPVSGDKVGILQIDAQTGGILTRYTEIKSIFGEIQSKLGIQSLPKVQQDRLHYLLAQNRDGKLNAQQQQELDALMEAADALELNNLKRMPKPDRPKFRPVTEVG
jgi:hypothetical protein